MNEKVIYDYARCGRIFVGGKGDGVDQFLPFSDLYGYGPLRKSASVFPGDKVRCWAGVGILEQIGHPFNGVQGIHAYADVRILESGHLAPAMLDELELVDDLTTDVDGMLFDFGPVLVRGNTK